MKRVKLDPLSYTAFPLKLYNVGGLNDYVATGFYFEIDNRLWLITNWHNVTGFDLDTQKRKEDAYSSPVKVGVPIIVQTPRGIEWKWYSVELYDDEKPKWLIHPVHKTRVDVIALEIASNVPENKIIPINKIEWDKGIEPIIADNIYVLGFPYGLRGGGNFPIWKRATVASEPDIDYQELPQFIIDTTTRKGMSGSPVVMRRQGIHNLINNQLHSDSILGEVQNFIGIYSGRFYANELEETQLGRVWKAHLIQETIEGGVKDKFYYPHTSSIDDGQEATG